MTLLVLYYEPNLHILRPINKVAMRISARIILWISFPLDGLALIEDRLDQAFERQTVMTIAIASLGAPFC